MLLDGAFRWSGGTRDLSCWCLWLLWSEEVPWQGLGRGKAGVAEVLIHFCRKKQVRFFARLLPGQVSAEPGSQTHAGEKASRDGGLSPVVKVVAVTLLLSVS